MLQEHQQCQEIIPVTSPCALSGLVRRQDQRSTGNSYWHFEQDKNAPKDPFFFRLLVMAREAELQQERQGV